MKEETKKYLLKQARKRIIKKNILAVFNMLLFLFGIGLMIIPDDITIKLFGLIFFVMSINSY